MPGRTIAVPLAGASRFAQYVLPANVLQYVDAVYVELDNSGGGDAVPVLTLQGLGDEPVAVIPQDEPVPGGDTGRATWAAGLPRRGAKAAATALSWATAASATGASPVPAGASSAGYGLLQTNDPSAFSLNANRVSFDKPGVYQVFGQFRAIDALVPTVPNPWTTTLQGGPGTFPGVRLFGALAPAIDAPGTSNHSWQAAWFFVTNVDVAHVGGLLDWNWNNLTGQPLPSVRAGVTIVRLSDAI